MSDNECTHDLSEYSNNIVVTNKAWHDKKSANTDTVIQFNDSNPALNHNVQPISHPINFSPCDNFLLCLQRNYKKYFTEHCDKRG
jgi:hypothetical protein